MFDRALYYPDESAWGILPQRRKARGVLLPIPRTRVLVAQYLCLQAGDKSRYRHSDIVYTHLGQRRAQGCDAGGGEAKEYVI